MTFFKVNFQLSVHSTPHKWFTWNVFFKIKSETTFTYSTEFARIPCLCINPLEFSDDVFCAASQLANNSVSSWTNGLVWLSQKLSIWAKEWVIETEIDRESEWESRMIQQEVGCFGRILWRIWCSLGLHWRLWPSRNNSGQSLHAEIIRVVSFRDIQSNQLDDYLNVT